MTNKIVISIDAMGGENAPAKCIEGVALFIKKNKSNDFIIQLHGEEENIISELKKNNIYKHDQIEIFKASSVVSDEDTPLTAIKNSKLNNSKREIVSNYFENYYKICFELKSESMIEGHINY